LYYRHGEVAVTSRTFYRGVDRYPIADLSDLMRARGSIHPGVTFSIVIAVVQAPLVVLVAGLIHSPYAWAAAVVVLVVPFVVAAICARRWPPRQELLARYRGRDVRLFSSRDEREFGQVARAVGRAIEALPDR
jgi:hypothetical protein